MRRSSVAIAALCATGIVAVGYARNNAKLVDALTNGDCRQLVRLEVEWLSDLISSGEGFLVCNSFRKEEWKRSINMTEHLQYAYLNAPSELPLIARDPTSGAFTLRPPKVQWGARAFFPYQIDEENHAQTYSVGEKVYETVMKSLTHIDHAELLTLAKTTDLSPKIHARVVEDYLAGPVSMTTSTARYICGNLSAIDYSDLVDKWPRPGARGISYNYPNKVLVNNSRDFGDHRYTVCVENDFQLLKGICMYSGVGPTKRLQKRRVRTNVRIIDNVDLNVIATTTIAKGSRPCPNLIRASSKSKYIDPFSRNNEIKAFVASTMAQSGQ